MFLEQYLFAPFSVELQAVDSVQMQGRGTGGADTAISGDRGRKLVENWTHAHRGMDCLCILLRNDCSEEQIFFKKLR